MILNLIIIIIDGKKIPQKEKLLNAILKMNIGIL